MSRFWLRECGYGQRAPLVLMDTSVAYNVLELYRGGGAVKKSATGLEGAGRAE